MRSEQKVTATANDDDDVFKALVPSDVPTSTTDDHDEELVEFPSGSKTI